mmetsp:Transcript_29115/g.41536  ORF Transcript_29115/g.41536 Transcript_29115/m.41536 type:complete len:192 (-) Transcript_29115:176-751(-)
MSIDVQRLYVILILCISPNLFNSGRLPLDMNGIYTFFLLHSPPNQFLMVDFCGYHSSFYLTGTNTMIKFMVVGYPSYSVYEGNCEILSYGTANNNVSADSMVSMYANLIANTITDYNRAWFFELDQMEAADACNWDFGYFTNNSNLVVGDKKFLMQQMWVPRKGCVMPLDLHLPYVIKFFLTMLFCQHQIK